MKYDDELYHYGRSKKDGAPGVGTGNWRRYSGAHWGDRTSQYAGNLLSGRARKKYIKKAVKTSKEQLERTIGVSSTVTKQQNRYLSWARARNRRLNNKDDSKRASLVKKEHTAKKTEARFYQYALKGTFSAMKNLAHDEVPNRFYNEDIIAKAFNTVYDLKVIEPAWDRFNRAIDKAKNASQSSDESFENFRSNKAYMKRYGYSDELSDEAKGLDLSMEEMAYVEWLLRKDKV